MDDRQKTRLIMLAISGILLGAGWYGYVWYQEQKTAQLEEEQVPIANVRRPIPKPAEPPANSAGTTPQVTKAPAANNVPPTTLADRAAPNTVAAPPTVAQTPVQPNVKSPVQATAKPAVAAATAQPATKPPAPAQVAAKPPVTAPAQPATKSPVAQPTAVAAVRPAPQPQAAASKPQATAAVQQPATAAPAIQVTAIGPNGKAQYLATTMDSAIAAATTNKGRPEPTGPLEKLMPWPRSNGKAGGNDAAALLALVPPPPPDKPIKPKKIDEKLVPPPPPAEATGAAAGLAGLPIDQLPVPPSRPTIGDKMKVISVFDDKAIISFPRSMQIKNKWPRTITLGTGEQFESLTIVSINRDGVTIEEDGERSMKPLSAVK